MMQCGVADVQNSGGEWTEVLFNEDFPSDPVLIAYTMSRDGGTNIRARVKEVSSSSFKASLEIPGSSGVDDASTALEKIGWLAIESGQGVLGGKKYVAEDVSSVDAESGKFEFPKDYFTAPPKVLGAVASADGTNTAGVRLVELSTESAEIRIEADADNADPPAAEKVALLALESPSMGGVTVSASPLAKGAEEDPVIKEDFEPVVVGKIMAPSSDATMSGPFKDTVYCLNTCAEEEDCCGVITVPAGLCWLKSKSVGNCGPMVVYTGAESYKKKAPAAALLTKKSKKSKRAVTRTARLVK